MKKNKKHGKFMLLIQHFLTSSLPRQGKQFALNTRYEIINVRTHCIALFYQMKTENHPILQGKDHWQ